MACSVNWLPPLTLTLSPLGRGEGWKRATWMCRAALSLSISLESGYRATAQFPLVILTITNASLARPLCSFGVKLKTPEIPT